MEPGIINGREKMPNTTRNTLDLLWNLMIVFGIGIGFLWIVLYYGAKFILWYIPKDDKE